MSWLVGRGTFLIWRIIQIWTFFIIMILETVRASQNSMRPQYWLRPQAGIWISEGVSFIIIGYLLIKFNKRWKAGHFKEDVILDWVLFTVWFLQIVLNMAPSTISNCEPNSYETGTYDERTQCHMFLASAVLSFFALFTIIVTLIFSITRWKYSQQFLSPCDYDTRCRLERPYVIKKGLLGNGEPALFFYSKNTSTNRAYEKNNPKLKNLFSKTSTISPLPSSISISIPEPEIAATANHVKDMPDVDVIADDKNEKDDLTLKY